MYKQQRKCKKKKSLTLYLFKTSFVKPYLKKNNGISTLSLNVENSYLHESSHAKKGALDISLPQVSRIQETRLYLELLLIQDFARHDGKEQKQPMTLSLSSRSLEYSWEKKINFHETITRQLKKYMVCTGV